MLSHFHLFAQKPSFKNGENDVNDDVGNYKIGWLWFYLLIINKWDDQNHHKFDDEIEKYQIEVVFIVRALAEKSSQQKE